MARVRTVAALALAALALALAGCSNGWAPARLTAPPPATPVAPTPVAAVELLQWAYDHRSLDTYRTLFADDFVFNFGALDPAGDPYRDQLWRREDELASAEHLFVSGNAVEGPAVSITLDFDVTPVDVADTTGGRDPRSHRQVRVGCVLDIQRPSGSWQVKGSVDFHLVRGDVAVIPPELGVQPDSTRWYIGSWDDFTGQMDALVGRTAPPAAPQPAGLATWGLIKTLYL